MNPIPSVRVVLTSQDQKHTLNFNGSVYFNGLELHQLRHQLETTDQWVLQNIALGMSNRDVKVNHFLAKFAILKTEPHARGFDTQLNRDDLKTYLEFRKSLPGGI